MACMATLWAQQHLARYSGAIGNRQIDLPLPSRLVDVFLANINPILPVPLRGALQIVVAPTTPSIRPIEPLTPMPMGRPIIGGPIVALPVAQSIFAPQQLSSVSFNDVATPSTFVPADGSLFGNAVQIEVVPQAPYHVTP